jgi:hypothetical protein
MTQIDDNDELDPREPLDLAAYGRDVRPVPELRSRIERAVHERVPVQPRPHERVSAMRFLAVAASLVVFAGTVGYLARVRSHAEPSVALTDSVPAATTGNPSVKMERTIIWY